MKTYRMFPLLICLAAAMLLLANLALPGADAPAVRAAGAQQTIPTLTPSPVPTATRTPTPNPTATAAAAFFTLGRTELVSRYPEGVEFVLRISSRAGEITRAQVVFWNSDDAPRQSAPLTWDESRQAFVYYYRFFQPPWIPIHYLFRVTDSAGNAYETEPKRGEYEDNTRQWTRLENQDVVVLIFGARESLSNELFASSADAMLRLEDAFGFSLDYKPYVVVMPDAASFQEWQEHPEPFLAGQTLQELGYTIQTLQWGEQDLIHTTIPHELTHIFQGFIQSDDANLRGWFIEGDATYFEPVQQYDYEARVRQWANALPSLHDEISAEFPGPDGGNRWNYDVGYTFIKYWIDTFGLESHRLFWQAQVEMEFEDALAYATGVSFDDLEAGWRAYLGARGPAPTPFQTPTLAFNPFAINTPTPRPPGG